MRNFIAERDWQPDPGDNEFEYVSVYGYICVDLSRDGGAEYVHYGPAGQQGPEGEPGQPTAMLAATTSTAECHAATKADGLSFTAIPADPVADPIPSFTDGTGYYSPATESLPSGDYVISEAVTGVSTGTLRLSGVHNIDFLQYEPLPTASVTVDVASADPAIANALPADATWSVSQNGTELFGDTFIAGHLQLPASIAITDPVTYGTYEVTVNAGPTFEPYTQSFTVDEAVEVFAIVLQPVSREPTAPVETNDVVVTVTTVDGGDIPTGTEICLTGSAYADCGALDAVAGSMIAAAPSGTTVAFSDVPLGTYELTIPANDPYLAHAETIRVPEENPYQVLVVLLLQDVTPSPTVTPGTVTPTATANPGTATATATQAAVTGLPSTGNGAGDESSRVSTALLIGGSALAFSLALGLAWHQRRTQGANVSRAATAM